MALTLNEYLKNAKDPIAVGVIKNMLRQSDILSLLPVHNVDAMQVSATRWQTLPSTGKRNIGGTYTESTGVKEQVTETLFLYGGDIQVDRIFTKLKPKFVDELRDQMAMKGVSLASTFNYDFIANDHSVDPQGIEGLQKRVSNAPSRMTVDLAQATDSLKVLASVANEHLFIDGLHEAVHKVKGGQQGKMAVRGFMLMNEATYLGVGKALRRAGVLSNQKDQYDRTWETFMGFALIDVGLKNDQSTEIITSTEDPGDGGNDATSIYVVRVGEDDGLHMIQARGTSPAPYDPIAVGEGGVSSQGPSIVRRIDWAIGLRSFGSYSIARIKGFKMAAS